MCKYGESKTTRIMMATARHVTSVPDRKFETTCFFVEQRGTRDNTFTLVRDAVRKFVLDQNYVSGVKTVDKQCSSHETVT